MALTVALSLVREGNISDTYHHVRATTAARGADGTKPRGDGSRLQEKLGEVKQEFAWHRQASSVLFDQESGKASHDDRAVDDGAG